jgi:hypothetical protein
MRNLYYTNCPEQEFCQLCALSRVESQSRIQEDVLRRVIILFIGLLLAPGVIAQNSEAISGEWLITRDAYGNPLYRKRQAKLMVEHGRQFRQAD